jgi:hypothetical protein
MTSMAVLTLPSDARYSATPPEYLCTRSVCNRQHLKLLLTQATQAASVSFRLLEQATGTLMQLKVPAKQMLAEALFQGSQLLGAQQSCT